MEKKVSREINRCESLDGETVIGTENLPIEKSERKPVEGEVCLDGFSKTGNTEYDNGFRVKWTNGAYNCKIEEKINGVWTHVGGVQKLTIEFSVDSPIPIVKMERYII